MSKVSTFLSAYSNATKIAYDPNWANGTGYYDYAVTGEHAPHLEEGEVVACTSPSPNNRKIVIIGTVFGNVVVFERYTDGASGVFVSNVPDEVKALFRVLLRGSIEDDMMIELVGDITVKNIGKKLQDLKAMFSIHCALSE